MREVDGRRRWPWWGKAMWGAWLVFDVLFGAPVEEQLWAMMVPVVRRGRGAWLRN